MNIETFFAHYEITEHPFRAEEAKDDPVYRRLMHEPIAHPDFAKIFGNPDHPDTSVVFGEKGTGKTALKLLMETRYREHNLQNPDNQVWVVQYDDLNPSIDRIVRRLQPADPADALKAFRLQDHIDSILIKAVTRLVDLIVGEDTSPSLSKKRLKQLRKMDLRKRMDLALLAILYDHPPSGHTMQRFKLISRFFRFRWVPPPRKILLVLLACLVVGGVELAMLLRQGWTGLPMIISSEVLLGVLVVLFLVYMWRKLRMNRLAKEVLKEVRVIERDTRALARLLSQLPSDDLSARPLPLTAEQDIRYQYVARFLDVLDEIGVRSMVVIVDRIDEPALALGDPVRMRSLVWPMLNNKFLQQNRTGFKMLLPLDLRHLLLKEDPTFFQTARLDKQNFIEKLEWSGATLYDVCSQRLQACRGDGSVKMKLTDIFDNVSRDHLVDALDQMHQPRDAFKFLYHVIQEHCRTTPDEEPSYQIARLTLDQVRQQQSDRVNALHRGLSPG